MHDRLRFGNRDGRSDRDRDVGGWSLERRRVRNRRGLGFGLGRDVELGCLLRRRRNRGVHLPRTDGLGRDDFDNGRNGLDDRRRGRNDDVRRLDDRRRLHEGLGLEGGRLPLERDLLLPDRGRLLTRSGRRRLRLRLAPEGNLFLPDRLVVHDLAPGDAQARAERRPVVDRVEVDRLRDVDREAGALEDADQLLRT